MHTIRIAAVGLALFALAACGKKEDDQPTAPGPAPADAAAVTAPPPAPPDAAVVAETADAAPAPAPTPPDAAPAKGEGPKPPPDPKEGPPKNLKVLPKSWSRKQVTDYMKKEMNRGLGVKCKFCHDPDDYAADTKHKKVALDMLEMTNDVNKRFFRGKSEVTCYTCHLGKEEPPK